MTRHASLREAIARVEAADLEVPDELLLMGEQDAVDRHFDLLDLRRLTTLVWVLMAVLAVYALVGFASGRVITGGVAGALVVADLVLLRGLRRGTVALAVRPLVAAVLVGHMLALQAFHPIGNSDGLGLWFVVLPLLATRFRLATGEAVALYSSLYAVVVLRLVGEAVLSKQRPPFTAIAAFALVHLAAFALAWWWTRLQRRRFVGRWRAQSGRERDRLRMKQELEYAREIQLSMLPRQAPSIDWLDIAALSLPATEVGGDYYDYFALGGDRIAVVVGDVTGHGVASGLVLSGVRSSLNLLADELCDPGRVLARLNTMLKRTAARRMLMTLGVAVLDHGERTVAVATAGHPPVLTWSAVSGAVEEVGQSALPLGALAAAEYRHQRVRVAAGDALMLYSDGLPETTGESGEQYGFERLERAFRAAATAGHAARGIRDAVLRDLWEHKGDAEQVDDVTMVVIRCR